MASKKEAKEAKEAKEEPECCSICSEHYTPILRKKVTCKFCQAMTCCKCIEHYLLGKHEDAHCLHCRVNYTDAMLKEICTKTYLQQRYFKHRQEVLINRERASLPGLQAVAMEVRKRRERTAHITVLNREMAEIKNRRDHIYLEHHLLTLEYRILKKEKGDIGDLLQRIAVLDDQVREYSQQMYEKRELIYKVHMEGRQKEEEKEDDKRKFIRRCVRTGCQGFLSTAWKCGICEWYSCSKCFTVRGQTHDAEHECKKEDVETAELIKKDCKPCPNCGEFIEKSSGCFAADTAILLWNGSSKSQCTFKMSQDIAVGDELIGDDGGKRTVLSTVSGEDTMYEVAQNNGMTYVVNSKHTLVLKKSGGEPIEILLQDYLLLSQEDKQLLFGYMLSGMECTISVKEVGWGSYYGWAVDGNKRFLLVDSTILRNCSQMFCITCKTPWDWGTGKVVTSGPLHNPHYYEWMQRNGQAMARNPADVPCGGYPNAWELRRMPRRIKESVSHLFYEFHRVCQELQDVSTRNYRSHIDNTNVHDIHTRFLLGDFDEKHWGQLMAVNEKKRKRDQEIQDIFAAFRMIAVEFINRIHLYHTPQYASFTDLPVLEAENILLHLNIEIQELVTMINTALKGVSQSYSYAVPYINRTMSRNAIVYNMATMNFVEKKKKRGATSDASATSDANAASDANAMSATNATSATNAMNASCDMNDVHVNTTSVSHAADANTIEHGVVVNEMANEMANETKTLGANYRTYPLDSDEEIDPTIGDTVGDTVNDTVGDTISDTVDDAIDDTDNVYSFAALNKDLQRAIIASLTQ